ncbi:MAG: hypothetical protein AAFX86_06190 [Pseudomonadota bacterium]
MRLPVVSAIAVIFFMGAASADQDTDTTFNAAVLACLEQDCAAAENLVDTLEPGSTRDLLAAWTRWNDKPNRSSRQRRLDRELRDIVDTSPTVLSTAAFRTRYEYDFATRDWARAFETAGEAADHFEPPEEIGLNEAWARARMAEIISDVQRGNMRRPRLLMAHLTGRLWQDRTIALTDDGSIPDWIVPLFWETVAWDKVLRVRGEGFFARGQAREQDISAIYNSYGLNADGFPPLAATHDTLPFCEAEFSSRLEPTADELRELGDQARYGAVILGYDLEAGRPKNVEVLSAVPNEIFDDIATRQLENSSFVPDIERNEIPCQLDAANFTTYYTYSTDYFSKN